MSNTHDATPAELVERAKALIPVVRSRRAQGDEQRFLPRETVEDFINAGFVRAVTPKRWGGMGHDVEVVMDISLQVGRGDGASGWLASFIPAHQFMVGWFSEEAQSEYWGPSPDMVSSTVNLVRGLDKREEVEGGLVLSGRGYFSSGVDYAKWLIAATPNENILVPKRDFTIVDDWYTSGLRGTGSKALTFEDVFVPQHRIVSHEALGKGTYPGTGLSDSPWYHVANPGTVILNHFIMTPAIGMAWGVLDLFDERARGRTDPQTLLPATERPGPQLRYAEAHAELTAAECFLRKNLATVRRAGEQRVPLTLEARAEIRRNIAYGAKLATQATNRLVDGMDSSALYDTNHLIRQAADVRASCLQFVMHWEETAMQYSRVHWGQEPHTVMI